MDKIRTKVSSYAFLIHCCALSVGCFVALSYLGLFLRVSKGFFVGTPVRE